MFRIILGFIFTLSFSSYGNVLNVEALSTWDKCRHIQKTYPGAIMSLEPNSNTVVFKNGSKEWCDDKRDLNLDNDDLYHVQMTEVDLSDVLIQGYPMGYVAPIYKKNYSPGRFRNDQLFINTYIDLSSMTKAHLQRSTSSSLTEEDLKLLSKYLKNEIIKIKFLGFEIQMNKKNGAAAALVRVSENLEKNFPSHANWLKTTRNMSGGYTMRFISGTNRLSSHSWGIAVDFTLKNATPNLKWYDSYWKWVGQCAPNINCGPARTDAGARFRRDLAEELLSVQIFPENFDHFPPEIVQVFADEGFIWGGHWHHFDTMHFEYRPEFFN